ncbi:MAG: cytochrome c [Anaerolineae bacterium]|nr:cytochrome c [Anaerolineae bacterium]MDW8098896.1 cytochrome c [Anaerolineae bacterium]
MKDKPFLRRGLILIWILIILLLPTCGRRQEASPAAKSPTAPLAVTPLQAKFEQPTTMITVVATTTPTPKPVVDLERGKQLYESKGCSGCHGVQGEGVPGKAKGLAGTSLTEQEFTDILRTGGSGKLGNEHIFGPQKISPSGVKAIYAYIRSLSQR